MGGGVHDALRVLVITYAYALSDSRLQKMCRWGKKKEGNPYPYLESYNLLVAIAAFRHVAVDVAVAVLRSCFRFALSFALHLACAARACAPALLVAACPLPLRHWLDPCGYLSARPYSTHGAWGKTQIQMEGSLAGPLSHARSSPQAAASG